jgi:hypothetical protein
VARLDRAPAKAAGERDLGSVAMDVEAGVGVGRACQLQARDYLLGRFEAVPLTRGRLRGELARLSFDGAERGLEAVEAAPDGLRPGPDGQRPGRGRRGGYFRWSIGT